MLYLESHLSNLSENTRKFLSVAWSMDPLQWKCPQLGTQNCSVLLSAWQTREPSLAHSDVTGTSRTWTQIAPRFLQLSPPPPPVCALPTGTSTKISGRKKAKKLLNGVVKDSDILGIDRESCVKHCHLPGALLPKYSFKQTREATLAAVTQSPKCPRCHTCCMLS